MSWSDVLIGMTTQTSRLLRMEGKLEAGFEASNCSALSHTKERRKLIFTLLSPGFFISVIGTSIHPVDQVRNLGIFLTPSSVSPRRAKLHLQYLPYVLISSLPLQVDITIILGGLLTGLPASPCSPFPRCSPSHSQRGLCKIQTSWHCLAKMPSVAPIRSPAYLHRW